MKGRGRRIREKKTIAAMIAMYCRGNHGTAGEPCVECAGLQAYAHARLDRCVYGDGKPVCAKCPIHCYRPAERAAITRVMRYAGPRMLWRHPLLAVGHLVDARKAPPARPARRADG